MLVEGLLASGVEREQSQRLVLAFGARVFPHFDRVLATRPADPCAHLFAIAAAMRTKAAVGWSIRWLGEATAERARAIGNLLRRELATPWPRALRRHLRNRVVALIRAGRFASREAVGVAFSLLEVVEPERTTLN
jgi:hypothetical protein